MPAPSKVIRFVAKEDGKTYYGQPVESGDIGLLYHDKKPITAHVLSGSPLLAGTSVTTTIRTVSRLLTPLDPQEIGTIRGMGAQYSPAGKPKNAKPPVPMLFYKPLTALCGPEEAIVIPATAKDQQNDYECELCVVIGKRTKDVSIEAALDSVSFYCVTNDVSSRGLCAKGGQWGFGKSYDSWNPLGPVLVSSRLISSPDTLDVRTTVNGELKQDSNTSEMILSVAEIISHLSQGVTLEPGSIILTGSPLPLPNAREGRNVWLKHGDEVRCTVEELGTLINSVVEVGGPKLKAKL